MISYNKEGRDKLATHIKLSGNRAELKVGDNTLLLDLDKGIFQAPGKIKLNIVNRFFFNAMAMIVSQWAPSKQQINKLIHFMEKEGILAEYFMEPPVVKNPYVTNASCVMNTLPEKDNGKATQKPLDEK